MHDNGNDDRGRLNQQAEVAAIKHSLAATSAPEHAEDLLNILKGMDSGRNVLHIDIEATNAKN